MNFVSPAYEGPEMFHILVPIIMTIILPNCLVFWRNLLDFGLRIQLCVASSLTERGLKASNRASQVENVNLMLIALVTDFVL